MLIGNTEIRNARGKIPKWMIAEKLGVHENTLNGWLRKELNKERKEQIIAIIEELKIELQEIKI
jgi:hypothetical protein